MMKVLGGYLTRLVKIFLENYIISARELLWEKNERIEWLPSMNNFACIIV